jgi:hypothetical protein
MGGDVIVVKAMADAISLRPVGISVAKLGARKNASNASLMLLQSVLINDNAKP